MADTTMPTTFQSSVAYPRTRPRRSRCWREISLPVAMPRSCRRGVGVGRRLHRKSDANSAMRVARCDRYHARHHHLAGEVDTVLS